ncbi:MAG: viperin family antiviral radical SAM protein [Marinomonas sp.]
MKKIINELVINFHMTETCNYSCTYCYATWEASCDAKELHRTEGAIEALIDRLADYFLSDNPLQQSINYQSVRLNLAGGEPMVLGQRFVDALLYAKSKGFRTSIITNGAFLDQQRLIELSPHIDVLGVSFDTADEIIASSIGRMDRKGSWISAQKLAVISSEYKRLNPAGLFKVNTVVNQYNHYESLVDVMTIVSPDKWKLLRVLPVFDRIEPVTDIDFAGYVERHSVFSHICIIEDNLDMAASYLMINPNGCFYQNGELQGGYEISEPILQVGVPKAFEQIRFDADTFLRRYNSEARHV